MTILPPFITDTHQDSIVRTESIMSITRGQDDDGTHYIAFTSTTHGEIITVWHYPHRDDRDRAFAKIGDMFAILLYP